jgi:hypothetical protein
MAGSASRAAAGVLVASLAAVQTGCSWQLAETARALPLVPQGDGVAAKAVPEVDAVRSGAMTLSARLRGYQNDGDDAVLYQASAEIALLNARLDRLERNIANDRDGPTWGVDAVSPTAGLADAPLDGAESLLHAVSISTHDTPLAATEAWRTLVRDHSSLLDGLSPRIAESNAPGQGLRVELKIGPFANRDDAASRCAALRLDGSACSVTDYSGRSLQSVLDETLASAVARPPR